MQHRHGDLFTTDAKIIAHGANTVGVMGAGVAKTLKEKYPKNYKDYYYYCKVQQFARPGEWYANDRGGPLILNLFTQDAPGPNARYEWVFSSIMNFLDFYSKTDKRYGKTIAIPEIGSGIGGLEWAVVEKLLVLTELIYHDFEFEVWHYESN
jgi:O-acetyl-ADP-ribose deacetylase (regulator of RNase III)